MFVAAIIVCFFFCMILGMVLISDTGTFKRLFVLEPVYSESKSQTVVDLSFYYKLNISNSSHASLLPERNSSFVRNSNVVMSAIENSDIVSRSAAVHVNVDDSIFPNYDVHIFYYPWYGNPTYDGVYRHWNHQVLPHWKAEISARYPIGRRHQPPDDISSSFYPKLGPYSSRDPSVVADHMRQIRQSGAGLGLVFSINVFNLSALT